MTRWRGRCEFARDIGAETVVVPAGTSLDGLEAIADQAGVNVAVLADRARPAALLKALAGKSKRIGIGIDTGQWAQEGVSPARRSGAGERTPAVPQAARPFRARSGRPERAPRPGHRRSESVVPGTGAAPDQASLDDARHRRRRQRSGRSVQGHRRVRGRRAAGVRQSISRPSRRRVRSGGTW